MIMAIAAAPIILSPKGTMGTQARRRAVAQPDSSARGRTYAAFIQPEPMSGLHRQGRLGLTQFRPSFRLFDEQAQTCREPDEPENLFASQEDPEPDRDLAKEPFQSLRTGAQ